MLSDYICPAHNFKMISTPRGDGVVPLGMTTFKCALKGCYHSRKAYVHEDGRVVDFPNVNSTALALRHRDQILLGEGETIQ